MRCSAIRHLLPLHAGEDLPGALARRVEAHVAGCGPCAKALADLRGDRALFAAVRAEQEAADPELDETFWYGIQREIRSGRERPTGHAAPTGGGARAPAEPAWRGFALRGVAVAAVALFAFVLYGRPFDGAAPRGVGPIEARGVQEPVTVAGRSTSPAVAPSHAVPRPVGRYGFPIERAALGPLAIERAETFAPDGLEFHLERWDAADADREELSF